MAKKRTWNWPPKNNKDITMEAARREGGKYGVNIAQISELHRVYCEMLAERNGVESIMIKNGERRIGMKKRKK